MKRQPLTLSEHQQLGQQLKSINDSLLQTRVLLANHYGEKRRVGRAARAAHARVEALRWALEDQIFLDHPEGADLNSYFGARQSPETPPSS